MGSISFYIYELIMSVIMEVMLIRNNVIIGGTEISPFSLNGRVSEYLG